jgi:hypothetical protein
MFIIFIAYMFIYWYIIVASLSIAYMSIASMYIAPVAPAHLAPILFPSMGTTLPFATLLFRSLVLVQRRFASLLFALGYIEPLHLLFNVITIAVIHIKGSGTPSQIFA